MHDVTIRPEWASDRSAIAEVVTEAFGGAVEPRLVEKIRASPNFVPGLSLVAETPQCVVGYVMISHVSVHDADRKRRIASLSPLAVAPAFQGQGIGSALVRDATARADAHGEPVVVLEGSPSFYGRLGFEAAASLGIHMRLPSWAPPEAAQVLRLRSYDPSLRGRVVYPPAFDDVTEH